jgi:acyl CoA:acetate/3-ketoacid CoA transferase alpha subunit
MRILQSGRGAIYFQDPDAVRAQRAGKDRGLTEKLMSEREAVARFVADGDYIGCDLTYFIRGPNALLHEIIRQRRRDLWFCAKYCYAESVLLLGGGCLARIDAGFVAAGERVLTEAMQAGRVSLVEWTNDSLTLRLLAGAMGVPFLPTRTLLGTDTLRYSGAKVVEDPFSGKPICLVPALNPDVGLIHAHQADVYGNARIFGASTAPLEQAMAAKKVIVQAEAIIEPDEIRRHPQRTTIPYYLVDAVVHVPYGAYPGTCPGRYRADMPRIGEVMRALDAAEALQRYLETYVYGVESFAELLERHVGVQRLLELSAQERYREGYDGAP